MAQLEKQFVEGARLETAIRENLTAEGYELKAVIATLTADVAQNRQAW